MLNFAAPGFLALGLLALVVVLLHSRRQRRQVVGSLRLWQELRLPAGARRARRQWPPVSLPMLLQIGAVVAFALALAQPNAGSERAPEHLVVVLDASAEMGIREDGGRKRLDIARAELEQVLGGTATIGPERLSVVVAGPRPEIAAARWTWREGRLDAALEGLTAADAAADWDGVARRLEGVLNLDEEETRLLFVSAEPVPATIEQLAGEAIISLRVGTPQPRLQVNAEMRALDATEGRWRINGEAAFLDGLEAQSALTVGYASSPDVSPLPWAEIALEPGEDARAEFEADLELPGPGILTLRAPARNGTETLARFVLEDRPGRMDVLYLGAAAEQPLLRALRAREGVDIYQADRLPDDVSRFALVVIDGVTVARAPETNSVWIGAARVEGTQPPEPLDEPDPDSWNNSHPLSANLDWSELVLDEAVALAPRHDSAVLLESGGAALIQAGTGPFGRELRLAFDPAQSNWPGQAGFPIFASALIDWMAQRPGDIARSACIVGERCAMDPRLAGETLTPVEGAADLEPVTLTSEGFVPRRAGLYRLGNGEDAQLVAINPGYPPTGARASGADPSAGSGDPVIAIAGALPHSWAIWFLAAAAAFVIGDTVLAMRHGGTWLNRMRPLAFAAIGGAVLAWFNAPFPVPQAREMVIGIESPVQTFPGAGEATSAGGFTGPRLGVIRAGASPAVISDTHSSRREIRAASPGPLAQGEAALELAAAMIPPDRDGRIVLGSDLASRPADLGRLGARDIVVDHLSGRAVPDGEVAVRGIELPRHVLAGDGVPMIGLVHAQTAMDAVLTVRRDGETIAEQDAALEAGNNRIETVLPGMDEGETLIELEIAAPGDTFTENNRAGRIVKAAGARPIAVISPSREHGEALAALLERGGLEAEVVAPSRAPQHMRGFLEYGGVVMLNTPAIGLSIRQMRLLETAVSQHGIGLLMLGGENSFGPGGYFETPLEQLSPLSSRVPRDAPEVAMAFVLDRSGSMQQRVGDGNRLDVAKQATRSAAELLNPQSQISIVVFDAEARVLLPVQDLDIELIEGVLGEVDPGGGTAIYPGLVLAWEQMQGVDASARHIVVMTDGLSQPGDWPEILEEITAAGITVSAVAIGEGSDRATVETIAELGGGAAHVTRDFEALPSILSQEAMVLSAPIEEGRSQPIWRDREARFLRGLPDPMPPIEGFVLTTAKPEARLAMTTPDSEGEDAPLMAWWRYGHGNVLAFTSDATGLWTERWQRLEQYSALWVQALREFQPATAPPGAHLSARSDGETLQLTLTVLDREGDPRRGLDMTASVDTPESGTVAVPIREQREGIYHAHLPLEAPGRYESSVTVPYDPNVPVLDPQDETVSVAYEHSYPVHFDVARESGAAQWLAANTGGAARSASDVVTAASGLGWGWRGFWQVWAVLALTFFMGEMIRRYGPGIWPRRQGKPEGRVR